MATSSSAGPDWATAAAVVAAAAVAHHRQEGTTAPWTSTTITAHPASTALPAGTLWGQNPAVGQQSTVSAIPNLSDQVRCEHFTLRCFRIILQIFLEVEESFRASLVFLKQIFSFAFFYFIRLLLFSYQTFLGSFYLRFSSVSSHGYLKLFYYSTTQILKRPVLGLPHNRKK